MKHCIILWLCLIFLPAWAYAESDDAFVQSAEGYMVKEEYKSAIIQLKNALQTNPNNIKARLLLGEAYLVYEDGLAAEKEIRRVKNLTEDKARWLLPLVKSYLLQGKLKEAFDEIGEIEKLPESIQFQAKILQATILLRANRRAQAKEMYLKLFEQEPKNPDVLLGLARIALLEGKATESLARVEESLAIDAKHLDSLLLKAEIFRLQTKYQDAIVVFSKVLSIRPFHLRALIGQTACYIAVDDLKQAQINIQTINQQKKGLILVQYLHALLDYKDKREDQALEKLQSVLRVLPKHVPSNLLIGAIYYNRNHYQLAEEHLSKVIEVVPFHLSAARMLGATYLKLNKPKKSVEILKPVADEVEDGRLFALLGTAYLRSGEAEKGEEILRKAVALEPDLASIRTQLALSKIATGKNEDALLDLESAVKSGDDLPQADALLILMKLRRQAYDDAVKASLDFVKKHPKQPLPYSLLGASYAARGELDKSKQQYREALKVDPTYTTAELNLAKFAMAEKDYASAKQHFNTILTHHKGHISALTGLAQIAENQGNTRLAFDYLRQAVDNNPEAIAPAEKLIKFYLSKRENLKALSIARQLRQHHQGHPKVLRLHGMTQLASNQYSSAVVTFEELVLLKQDAQAYHLLAGAQAKSGDLEAALDSLELALKADPNYLPALVARAGVATRLGDIEQAIAYAKVIQQKYPDKAEGYQAEADVYKLKKDYIKAGELYHKAYQMNPSRFLAMMTQRIFELTGKYEPGYEILQDWLSKHPKDVVVLRHLAVAYQDHGKTDKAINKYLQILDIAPKDVLVLNNVAWLYHISGSNKSLKFAEKAYDLAPDRAEVLDTYAWILLHNDELAKSLRLLKIAAQTAPHIPSIQYHLAFALYKDNRLKEAQNRLRQLLESKIKFPEREAAEKLLKAIKG